MQKSGKDGKQRSDENQVPHLTDPGAAVRGAEPHCNFEPSPGKPEPEDAGRTDGYGMAKESSEAHCKRQRETDFAQGNRDRNGAQGCTAQPAVPLPVSPESDQCGAGLKFGIFR